MVKVTPYIATIILLAELSACGPEQPESIGRETRTVTRGPANAADADAPPTEETTSSISSPGVSAPEIDRIVDSLALKVSASAREQPTDEARQFRVTRNDRSGAWKAGEEWRLRTLWRQGVEDGDEEQVFGLLTSVAIGPNSNVYILDFTNQTIRVFSSDGHFIRRIGRSGGGPGEFNGPLAMAWDHNHHLWVADGWNARYTVFDTSGTVIKSVRRRLSPATGWAQQMAVIDDGEILDEVAWSTGGQLVAGFARVDTLGSVRDTLPPITQTPVASSNLPPQELPSANDASRKLRPFRSHIVYTLAEDGTIWVAWSNELKLVHRAANGDTLGIIETTHRHPQLTRAENALIDSNVARLHRDRKAMNIAKQVIQSIHMLGDGHILVQIEEEAGRPSRTFDVFDSVGRFMGTIASEYPIKPGTIAATRGDTLVAISTDALDVHYILKLVLEPTRIDLKASRTGAALPITIVPPICLNLWRN